MAELLTRGSYESLGITRAEANIEDPTRFTPITPVDAKVIAENYIKEGSDSFKKDLTHYYACNDRNTKSNGSKRVRLTLKSNSNI